jgi:hypothetical protein
MTYSDIYFFIQQICLGLHHHYAGFLKTIHKTESFVPNHQLTVPEQSRTIKI